MPGRGERSATGRAPRRRRARARDAKQAARRRSRRNSGGVSFFHLSAKWVKYSQARAPTLIDLFGDDYNCNTFLNVTVFWAVDFSDCRAVALNLL